MIRNLIVMGMLATMLPSAHGARVSQEAPRSQDMDDEQSYAGEAPERYVQVRSIEGQATVRKGDLTEDLTRGVPLTEGDVVEARGRGVLQLADGSRIVFGEGVRFTLASLFAERDGTRQVVLRLDRGHLRVQVGNLSQATYRIDTPSGRGMLQERANASFEVDGDQSVRVKVFTGRIRFVNSQDRTQLAAGERLTVYSSQDRLDRIRDFNTHELEAFDGWAERQFRTTRGASYDRLPSSLRAYGEELDRDGEWVEVEDVGWSWRPRGMAADWRPYYQGRWGTYASGMTWISDEPWGYVTHHHGRWGWHARWGWHWVPGALYAPAWVAWRAVDSFFGWAPLGYWNHPVQWGYSHWNGGYCWNVVDYRHIHNRRIHTHIHSDVRYIRPFNNVAVQNPGRGGRLTPPWQQTPLLIRPNEARDPQQIRAALLQPDQQRLRLSQVARENPGRVILQRETPALRGGEGRGSDPAAVRQPFVRREQIAEGRPPIVREPSVLAEPRGERPDRGIRTERPERRTEGVAPSREGEGGLRPRPETVRRAWETGTEERRRDREEVREPRRESRSEEPRRESRPEPRRETRTEEPRRESRSEEPRRESRPEPRRETRSEEPRREYRSEPSRVAPPPARSEPPRSEPPRSEPPRSAPPRGESRR